ncbi:hypothetical protein BaRGS_00039581, partial [Batillaria attramentaria]
CINISSKKKHKKQWQVKVVKFLLNDWEDTNCTVENRGDSSEVTCHFSQNVANTKHDVCVQRFSENSNDPDLCGEFGFNQTTTYEPDGNSTSPFELKEDERSSEHTATIAVVCVVALVVLIVIACFLRKRITTWCKRQWTRSTHDSPQNNGTGMEPDASLLYQVQPQGDPASPEQMEIPTQGDKGNANKTLNGQLPCTDVSLQQEQALDMVDF